MGKNKKQKNKSSQMQRIIPFATAMLFHMTQARRLQGTAASNTTQFGEIAAESMELAEVEKSDGNGYGSCFATLDSSPSTSGMDDDEIERKGRSKSKSRKGEGKGKKDEGKDKKDEVKGKKDEGKGKT